ncbi:hypothetical protein F0U62_08225 [Cystobacter fuscus]|uniref:hypothetical protein n=1 Tax=Cystobacter fuscus TaxID=43 RepID=UPI002B2A2C95|nr:hypothetical protein F0U62_08225 [Cystobacter fuscus]
MDLLLPNRNMMEGGLEGTSKKSLSAPMAGLIIASPVATALVQHAAGSGVPIRPERLSIAARPTAPTTTTPEARATLREKAGFHARRRVSKLIRIMKGS